MTKHKLTPLLISFSGLAMVSAPAQAKEIAYDTTFCFAGTQNVLMATKELTVLAIDLRGIVRTNTGDKSFDNDTGHCVGVNRITEKHVEARGYCKIQSVNGDTYVGEYSASGPPGSGGTWTVFHGTGKWSGIKGGGPYRPITQGRPIAPGTFQSCNSNAGKYTLPD